MNEILLSHIRARQIDSFQKLRFLLFLHQNPGMKGTSQDFAERLYLGDTSLLEKIITDLQQAGLVTRVDNHYILQDKPEVKSCLQYLANAFENPVARQELLNQMRHNASLKRYQESTPFPYPQFSN